MKNYNISKHHTFYVIGLSYQKADAVIRGHFSLDESQKENLIIEAKKQGLEGMMVTSTCNRTEVYGFAEHPFQLIKLLCQFSQGSLEEFEKVAYVYKNQQAIEHIFNVGTGLDSQILGDFEIISQLKKAFSRSKKLEMVNPFIERLLNSVIQASKRIKNETEISSGATSVSFASVQYILNEVQHISEKNILLFGTGKIGRNTCENLVKHTKNDHITLINRTKDKAEKIAGKFNLIVKSHSDLQEEISKTDILIVATGAQQPTVSKEIIYTKKDLLILDLSIPKNVSENVEELANVKLVHLDHLSQITDQTLEKRKDYLPQARLIISEVMLEFNAWLETRKFAPTIKALKQKLSLFKDEELDFQRKKIQDFNNQHAEIIGDRIIQKIMNQFASHLKENNDTSEESLALIQRVFQLENLS
ncbi:glutamyl-tRNA reductase [Mesonia sp. K7]|uniref:glutamyl-tRNA reductase n=1 Tax=Mesonia sp. K7 TaxID=2218606 RepID=UPI000DA9C67B|nr:glutamyl-tRNA reductase [Mesonia sp. K7]PZD77439.1 glutamyl-tRNA reductase [Mesonia sp. K7]